MSKIENRQSIVDLFLQYTQFDTQSDETSPAMPSTAGQKIFAEYLAKQMREIGLSDVFLDNNAYLTATLPGNSDAPTIGFIAHLDTSPDASGKNVKPRIVNYKGGNIVLNEKQNIMLSPTMFPEMLDYIGDDIIVTDGTTLLGADDKAGIAAIIAAMKYLINHPEIQHGKVRIAFTPDEEIGRGADKFDVENFSCDWAYTIDGGAIGEFEYENFNAATATLTFKGRSIHSGYAKDKMINASLLANEYISSLPTDERPENTDGYDGFFHLTSCSGNVEKAILTYIIRDHDKQKFESRKLLMQNIAKKMNEKYPDSTTIEIRDQYYNMREKIEPYKNIIDIVAAAMKRCNITPLIRPIRGGTDGARLSFMGLPCPNIFAGGLNFHGPYEFLPVGSLEKCMNTIVEIIKINAQFRIMNYELFPTSNNPISNL